MSSGRLLQEADHAATCKARPPLIWKVFCEKPIATDLEGTIEAINACNDANVKLMTALQRRFDPNFVRVKQVHEAIKLITRDSCVCLGFDPNFVRVKQVH